MTCLKEQEWESHRPGIQTSDSDQIQMVSNSACAGLSNPPFFAMHSHNAKNQRSEASFFYPKLDF
jgi:hypothetical protein